MLELVGTSTLLDSLRCGRVGGIIVCMTGMLGGSWVLQRFQPMGDIPSGVKLTSYAGGPEDVTAAQLQRFIDDVAAGRAKVRIDKVFSLDEIVEAHRYQGASRATGKLVVLTARPGGPW